jgi:hypothetical protein
MEIKICAGSERAKTCETIAGVIWVRELMFSMLQICTHAFRNSRTICTNHANACSRN